MANSRGETEVEMETISSNSVEQENGGTRFSSIGKEDITIFRGKLIKAKNDHDKEEMTALFKEACQNQFCEIFVEECIIAGYDVSLVRISSI